MTLVEFYIKVLESTSFSIIEDVVYKDEEDVLTILDIPIALPTKKIINNYLKQDGTKNYIIFNPILEEVYTSRKNSNQVLNMLINMGKLNLSFSLCNIAKLLMGSTELKQTGMDIANFNTMLNKTVNNVAIKKIIDETAVNNIYKILMDNIGKELEPIRILLNKNGNIGKDKFSMVCSMYSPLLDYILEQEKQNIKIEEITGIKVRPKDVATIKTILNFMLCFEDEKSIKTGSSTNQPGLDSFLRLYVTFSEWFNNIAQETKVVDLELSEVATIPLSLTMEDIQNIPSLEREAKLYPSEGNLEANNTQPVLNQNSNRNSIMSKLNVGTVPTMNDINTPAMQAPDSNLSEYEKAKLAMAGKSGIQTEAIYNQIPTLNNYTGLRPDLHVANIYNNALPYEIPDISVLTQQHIPAGGISRLSNFNSVSTGTVTPNRHLSIAEKILLKEQQNNMLGNPYLYR